nr:type IV toxin-antitoxin system AbiEi family antitoxin domain-containing protein [Nitrosomonas nitrosa]
MKNALRKQNGNPRLSFSATFRRRRLVLQSLHSYRIMQSERNTVKTLRKPTGRQPATTRALKLIERAGVARTGELTAHGIQRVHLQRLEQRGLIERAGRGLYRLTDAELSEHESFIETAKRVPNGVLCLLSALNFHHLTTQNPFEVWLAIERGTHRPRITSPPLRLHLFSGAAFTEGIEEHKLEGVTVRVYSVAKTVADCFKYRNKIGLDVALEALRECRRDRRATADEIQHYAEICRVANVMSPYLEALW